MLSGMQKSLIRAGQKFTIQEEAREELREGPTREEEWLKKTFRKRNVHAGGCKLASFP